MFKTTLKALALVTALTLVTGAHAQATWYFIGKGENCPTLEDFVTTPPAPLDATFVHTPEAYIEWVHQHGHPEVKDITSNYPNLNRATEVITSAAAIEGVNPFPNGVNIFVNGLEHCRYTQKVMNSVGAFGR
jgi:hypothetical protein